MINDPWLYASVLGATIASVVGVVVWLVKHSFKRQTEITERYFAHLERQQLEARETNERLVCAFSDLSKVLHSIDQRTQEHRDGLNDVRKELEGLRRERTP